MIKSPELGSHAPARNFPTPNAGQLLLGAMNATEVALNRVFSPVPTTLQALDRMLDNKITYIKVYYYAEMKELRYVVISGLLFTVGMISLVMGTKLPLIVFGFSCVLAAAIALQGDFMRIY